MFHVKHLERSFMTELIEALQTIKNHCNNTEHCCECPIEKFCDDYLKTPCLNMSMFPNDWDLENLIYKRG